MRKFSIRTPLLGLLTVAGLLTTTIAATRDIAEARRSAATPTGDEWLDKLKGSHRELFDAPTPAGGIPLVHLMNFYDTYNKAYGVKDSDVNGIVTFYGLTTFHGLNDAMWSKYRIGDFLETLGEKTNKATMNPWRTAPVALGMTLPQASIESMQKRGATFIICNNALTIFSGMLAQSRGLNADSVYTDMKANILPGVTLVPGMVVAIEKAQQHGISYHRQ
jgi:intracellular sulfur oxidation DsrE/DsrF family protein